jgi:transposase
MSSRKILDEEQCQKIELAMKSSKTKDEYQRALSLWLKGEFKLSAPMISKMTGLSYGSVRNIYSRFNQKGDQILKSVKTGGRLRANMSLDDEKDFLRPFMELAGNSGILEVSGIHKAYETKTGKKVPLSTVYRLLARHGWRKIAPRPSHPKTDLEAQEAFKKTLPQQSPNYAKKSPRKPL